MTQIKLSSIIEEMEMMPDSGSCYLDKITGEILLVGDEEFSYAEDDEPVFDIPDWQKPVVQAAKKILNDDSNQFIMLPEKFFINDYEIMERFCNSISNQNMSAQLFNAIRGKGAFSRFRDKIQRLGLDKKWFQFHQAALKEIAIEWCEENAIDYIDDTGSKS